MLDTRTFVGVDVSKDHLDVAFPASPEVWRTGNDKSGIAALGRKLADLDRRLYSPARRGVGLPADRVQPGRLLTSH